jgi:hypothetical protein
MKGNRKRKWVIGLGVAGAALVLLVICGFVGWQMLMTHFVHQYHRETCSPIELSAGTIGGYPADYHLDDVPWLATREWYCSANSLAMVAAQHGTDASTARCSFLMGFTYGASEVPGSLVVQFFGEPEAGVAAAAPYLGLERRYYVTDDETLYLDALRYYLSQGYAVRLGLDVAVLYDLNDQLPHSDLLVGYDGTGFYIYETVCLPEFPCEPRHSPPGEEGLWVSDQTLLDAVLGQATMFSYPWRYSLTIFEEGPREDDLRPIWTRNGNLLIGGAQYGPRQGADAIERLAASIEKRGVRADVTEVSPALEAAVYNRRANAAYLREAFAGQADIERATVLFDRAADDYEAVLNTLDDGIADQAEADQIAARLRNAATAERKAGQIFLARGQRE